jgi:predicted lipoprotein with Yx(FWY)xxD motif
MKKLLAVLVAIVAAAAIAACGGGSYGGGSATAAASGTSGRTVSTANVGDTGRVLVDSSGQALYASDQEADGRIMCTGACLSFWKPLTIKGGMPHGSVPGKLGVITRPDGGKQVTFDGKPVYSFTQEGPGEVTGNGFMDAFDGQQFTWNVVAVSGSGGSSSAASDASPTLSY